MRRIPQALLGYAGTRFRWFTHTRRNLTAPQGPGRTSVSLLCAAKRSSRPKFSACTSKRTELSWCQLLRVSVSRANDLVQGTLNLRMLKNLALQPMHGWAIAQRIHPISGKFCKPARVPSIRLCTRWSKTAGSRLNGPSARTSAAPNTKSLARAGRNALEQETAQAERLSAAILLIVRSVEG